MQQNLIRTVPISTRRLAPRTATAAQKGLKLSWFPDPDN